MWSLHPSGGRGKIPGLVRISHGYLHPPTAQVLALRPSTCPPPVGSQLRPQSTFQQVVTGGAGEDSRSVVTYVRKTPPHSLDQPFELDSNAAIVQVGGCAPSTCGPTMFWFLPLPLSRLVTEGGRLDQIVLSRRPVGGVSSADTERAYDLVALSPSVERYDREESCATLSSMHNSIHDAQFQPLLRPGHRASAPHVPHTLGFTPSLCASPMETEQPDWVSVIPPEFGAALWATWGPEGHSGKRFTPFFAIRQSVMEVRRN